MSRTFVIGDIHGCFDELQELIEKIELKDEDMLISLGDIIDRGNKSKEVYHFFKNRSNSKVLMGNHERKHLNGILSYAQEIVKIQFDKEYDEFLNWINSLDYFYETDEAIIVHAAFEHDKEINSQREDVLSGSTSGERYLEKKYDSGKYWSAYYMGEKVIIYGHHVVGDRVKVYNNTFGIDTGVCHGGYLTAIELPGFIVHQVKSKKDYWLEEQKKWQIPVLKSKSWETMDLTFIQKQLKKLSYIEDVHVIKTLNKIENWFLKLDSLIIIIKEKIDSKTKDLYRLYGNNFNQEVAKLEYKSFVFKSKANNLTTADLIKSLDTPLKRLTLAKELDIDCSSFKLNL